MPANRKGRQQSKSKSWIVVLAVCILLAVAITYGVQNLPQTTAKSSPFNADRAFADLKTIVGFGPRPAGSEALARTRAYIVAELQKAGLKPQLDEFEAVTPRGRKRMVNIRALRPGARPEIIALSGHYDTKVFDFPFVGANDGGSSTAWVLEMARATSDLKLQHSLEFILFDGEEAVVEWTDTDSLYGSRYDVDRRVKEGSLNQLKALILVDMIGDRDLNIPREVQSTDWITDEIWNTARTLGYQRNFLDTLQQVSDDHLPYLRARIPAVDIIDFSYGPGNSYWHQPGDTLDKTSADSLKIVADAVYFSLQAIDSRLASGR
jgi:Zn-dependent M28 family amino/carboxypeptidase